MVGSDDARPPSPADEEAASQMELLARRVLRNPRSHPDEVREARYLLCVLERERNNPGRSVGDDLPPFPNPRR